MKLCTWATSPFANSRTRSITSQGATWRKHLITGNNDDAAVKGCDGWESIQAYAEVSVDGMHLVLCHYPFRTWRNMSKGWVNLHGHSHGRLKPLPRQFDVGVEVWNFRPVQLAEVLGGIKAVCGGQLECLYLRISDDCAHPSRRTLPGAAGSFLWYCGERRISGTRSLLRRSREPFLEHPC